MYKYKFYEKIQDRYIIQNIETLEVESVDEETYNEGLRYNLIDIDTTLQSIITRKLLVKESVLFDASNYQIVSSYLNGVEIHPKGKRSLNKLLENTSDYYVYIPTCVSDVKVYCRGADNIEIFCSKIDKIWFLETECEVLDLTYLTTKYITNMRSMFRNCFIGKIIFGKFDTSNVTDMSSMFYGFKGQKYLDLRMFDTSKVENMSAMFEDSKIVEVNVSSFNTQKVKNMDDMFSACLYLKYLDLQNFTSDALESCVYMFSGCCRIRTIRLNNFIGDKLKQIDEMFSCCKELVSVDINKLQLNNVEYARQVFGGCEIIKRISLLKLSCNIKSIDNWFYNCRGLKEIIVPKKYLNNKIFNLATKIKLIEG